MRHRWLAALPVGALCFGIGVAMAHQVTQGDLALAHPFVMLDPRCGPEVTRAHVMLIINSGTQADRLLAAEMDQAGKGKLVRVVTADGKARREVLADGIEIPAKGQIALMPPDLALEFPKSRVALVEGGATKGSLTFQRTGKVAVTFMVDAAHVGQAESGCGKSEPKPAHQH